MTDAQCLALIAARLYEKHDDLSFSELAHDADACLSAAKAVSAPHADIDAIATMAVLLYTHYQNGGHDVTIRMRDCIDEAIRAHRMVFGRVTAPVIEDTPVTEPRKTDKE